ncbi:MAG: hypothetical protein UV73_C0015G0018 [Candidatus Gottesmanbacteria bacterium GW2011_GWA2_43_14]|uniref:Uncharacterized protein n=1 Tax=Candidatus Gottesmanbacteria bacterium GW2011_GWA2_43_14 TaxID=1618443 RepID=A0A0G1G9M8_9BACT|nr:MAG: hypothetical protein UV73_C0015G0018 [Candidatus Gottesmanbacteria bacterium GW2011_GWA2_43_14]
MIKKLFIFLVSLILLSLFPKTVRAQPFDCGFKIDCVDPVNCKPDTNSKSIFSGTNKVKFSFDLKTIPAAFWDSYLDYDPANGIPDILEKNLNSFPDSSASCYNRIQWPKDKEDVVTDERPMGLLDCGFQLLKKGGSIGEHKFYLRSRDTSHNWFDICVGSYNIVEITIPVTIEVTSLNGKEDVNSEWKVIVTFPDKTKAIPIFRTNLDNQNLNTHPAPSSIKDQGTLSVGSDNSDIEFTLKPLVEGAHTIDLIKFGTSEIIASKTFEVVKTGTITCKEPNKCMPQMNTCTEALEGFCGTGTGYKCCIVADAPICKDCGSGKIPCEAAACMDCSICKIADPPEPLPSLAPICEQVDTQFRTSCKNCFDKGQIWTAVGCISTDLGTFISDFLYGTGLRFAGAIAFLYFLYGAFLYLTSGGNPERVAMGKEVIVSSLSGLLLLIFSLFLLKLIAVDILEIPGFTK